MDTSTSTPGPERANPEKARKRKKRRPTETDQDQRRRGRTEAPEPTYHGETYAYLGTRRTQTYLERGRTHEKRGPTWYIHIPHANVVTAYVFNEFRAQLNLTRQPKRK